MSGRRRRRRGGGGGNEFEERIPEMGRRERRERTKKKRGKGKAALGLKGCALRFGWWVGQFRG